MPNIWKRIRGWGGRRWSNSEYDRATAYAKQTKTLALEQLKQRKLDAEPHLPIALGAAYEVESQAMAAKRAAYPGGRAAAGCAGEIWKYFDSSAAAEESEPAVFTREGGAGVEGGAIAGSDVAGGGAVEGLSGAAVFLGALVRRLQGGGAHHYAVAVGVCVKGLAGDRADAALWLHGADRACFAERRDAVYRCGAASLLRRAARYAGAGEQVQLRYCMGRRLRRRWCCWIGRGKWPGTIRGRCRMRSCGGRLRRWRGRDWPSATLGRSAAIRSSRGKQRAGVPAPHHQTFTQSNFHFFQPSCLHIVDESPHRNMFRNPWVRFHALHLLPDVFFQVVEGVELRGSAAGTPIFLVRRVLSSSSRTFSRPQSVWLMMMNSWVSSR